MILNYVTIFTRLQSRDTMCGVHGNKTVDYSYAIEIPTGTFLVFDKQTASGKYLATKYATPV
jgi:hypothetical protein